MKTLLKLVALGAAGRALAGVDQQAPAHGRRGGAAGLADFGGVGLANGHQVQAGLEAVGLKQLHGTGSGFSIMAPVRETENFVIEGLSADFNGPDACGL